MNSMVLNNHANDRQCLQSWCKSLAVILQDGCFDIVTSARHASSVLRIQELLKSPASPSASET